MSKKTRMIVAGSVIAMLAVVVAVGAFTFLRPVGQLTVQIGGENSRVLASSVGADGIAEQNGGVYVGVVLSFNEVRLKDSNSGQWTTISAPGHFDIVALANHSGGTTDGSVLVQATIPQGTYSAIVLVIHEVTVTVQISLGNYTKDYDVVAQVSDQEVLLPGPITVGPNGVIVLITFSVTRSMSHNVGVGGIPTAAFSPSARLSVVA